LQEWQEERWKEAYNEESDEEPDLVNSQVYLNFACSMDMYPQELIDCVEVEYGEGWDERRSILRPSTCLIRILVLYGLMLVE
jgi:hypothetical protein